MGHQSQVGFQVTSSANPRCIADCMRDLHTHTHTCIQWWHAVVRPTLNSYTALALPASLPLLLFPDRLKQTETANERTNEPFLPACSPSCCCCCCVASCCHSRKIAHISWTVFSPPCRRFYQRCVGWDALMQANTLRMVAAYKCHVVFLEQERCL